MADNFNAYLSYTDDIGVHAIGLYVDSIEQPHELTVNTSQTRWAKQIYSRAYMPGDIAVSGRCLSQDDLQSLGLFIRLHHRALLNTPTSQAFTNPDSAGAQRLMKLSIPSERVIARGFIPSFQITKRGVFEPAPTYQFSLTVIFDASAATIVASRASTKYFNPPVENADDITSEYTYAPDTTSSTYEGRH